MTFKSLTLTFVFTSLIGILSAQNINGLKIYVSKSYATTLYFHDVYTKYAFGESTFPYKFNSLLSDEKSLALEVNNSVAEPYTLYVTEGGRKHKFIILYKEKLEDAERDVYFTDLDKVAQLSKAINSEPVAQASKTETPKVETPAPANNTEPAKAETTDTKTPDIGAAEINEIKYTGFVTKANNAFSANNFDDALKYYTAALAIKPDDMFTINQVQFIQKKVNDAKTEADMRRKDSSFKSYVDAGDKMLNDKSIQAAKIAYEEALKIKPGDAIAMQRLEAVNKTFVADSLKTQQQKQEDLFVNYLKLGDTAIMQKAYSQARIAYAQALQIKPNDANAKEKIRILDQNILSDSLAEADKKTEALYAGFINKADKAFKDKTFDKARYGYDSALIIKPRDSYAGNQIKTIDSIFSEQQRQAQQQLELQKDLTLKKQYDDLISKADGEYNSGLYDEASKDYAKALEINKNDQYSKNKVTQIKNLLSEKRLKQQQDSIDNAKYVAVVKKADNAFTTNDYINAKSFYKSALTYKSNDGYSNNRIAEIDRITTEAAAKKQAEKDSLDKIQEINTKYATLISDAQKAYNAKNYTEAKIKYGEAGTLKPEETEAKSKSALIDAEIAEIARMQALQNQSDSLITNGEIALASQLFPLALDDFKAAMSLNLPDQAYYLQRQVSYIQDQLNILEHQRQDEELKRNFDTAMSAYKQGQDSLQYLNYPATLSYFQKYLAVVGNMDSATLEQSQYNLVKITRYVRTKIQDINDALARKSTAVANKDVGVTKPVVAYAYYAPAIYYPNPKDPALGYVYRKYPDIDFFSSPTDQKFDSLLNFNVQSNLIGREIMSLNPDLELTDSAKSVKLICQNIVRRQNNVYLKFLVQNYSPEEFLAGRMLLAYKPGNSKDSVKMYPTYVANYPIVLSGRQRVLVYVVKPATIGDNENLHFELVDRLLKQKLEITIPGSVYNEGQKK